MEIIVMQNEAYRELVKETYRYLENLFRKQQEKPNEWLDNQHLMKQLKVSKRTLQNWRDQGLISFSQIGSKIYYNQKDIDTFLEKHINKSFNH
ncbi:helix-turn-helix domain-containing protein [Adhaeribacter terreus]|uniref:Helix-turn-helix domain-containing protein n=1 Tax=Adhaeribacter terreus TaxID=529703 RepID=A0ABW0EDQ3_9BACT